MINEYVGCTTEAVYYDALSLDVIISKLTEGSRKKWPRAKHFPSSELSVKYSILHKIAIKNWLPSSHREGVRKKLVTLLYIVGTRLYSILENLFLSRFVVMQDHKLSSFPLGIPLSSLRYPCLKRTLCFLMTSMRMIRKRENDPKEIRLSHKLFEGKHVADIEGGAGIT